MNKMNYRIAQQSKKMLTYALFELMKTNEYAMITVTQVCQEADLSRRTFYRLYETKEDILYEYMYFLAKEFMDIVSEKTPRHYSDVAIMYFDFWKQHEVFLKLLKRNKMLDIIYRIVGEMAPIIFNKIKPELDFDDETLSFTLSYSLGGLNGMLIRWVEDDMKMPSEQVKTILEGVFCIATI